jgi:hypothetical protein
MEIYFLVKPYIENQIIVKKIITAPFPLTSAIIYTHIIIIVIIALFEP